LERRLLKSAAVDLPAPSRLYDLKIHANRTRLPQLLIPDRAHKSAPHWGTWRSGYAAVCKTQILPLPQIKET
jgi:hypothetical protein